MDCRPAFAGPPNATYAPGVQDGETAAEKATETADLPEPEAELEAEPEAEAEVSAEPSESEPQPVADQAAADELAGWRRLAVTGGLIVALAVVSAAAGAAVVPQIAGAPPTPGPGPTVINPEPSASAEPDPTAFPTVEPSGPVLPTASARPATAFTSWATPLAGPLGIPQVALEAYGYAEWVLQQTRSTCKLQWTTLAAIGKVTTEHGKLNGSSLDSSGKQRPALIGPALNGTGGNPKVNDTDGGALDGDQTWDHTIGPMQFVPTMWRVSGVDGDSDDLADPQDIDDAALAAAYHLCSGGQDLSVAANWKAAVSAYHGLAPRIDKIFQEAQSYGVRSRS
jgi:hypothetical protein